MKTGCIRLYKAMANPISKECLANDFNAFGNDLKFNG